MPWKVKKVNEQYCVFDKDGKKMKCYDTAEKANDYRKALYANAHEKLESVETIMLENGPVIVGIAATNIPHLPLPPMSVVDVNGKKKIRVPFLRSGIFRHPNGELIFNDKVFDRMLENYRGGKSHYGVSLNEKHKPGAALAWFDEERGGSIVKENDPKYGTLLVGYGNPTSDKSLEMIENKEYVFASVEFNPNHNDVMVAKLSSDQLDEIQLEDLTDGEIKLEETMDEVTISLEEYNELKDKANKAEETVTLEQKLQEAETEVTNLKQKLVELEKPVEPELPEEVKTMLEDYRKENARLKKDALETAINLVITKAENYRDANGNGHDPVLLEIAKNAMLGNEIKLNEEKVIKLESGKPADVADYFRKIFVHLLETVPGTIRLESKTETPDDETPFNRGTVFTNDDYKSWWAESL